MTILSPDSQVLVLLCSHLGLSAEPEDAPLTLREWNPLARQLANAGLRPDVLLEMDVAAIQSQLNLSETEALRVTKLLQRGASVALELERLESLGIWTMTRADEFYPVRYRQRLKDSAPAVLFGSGDRQLLGQDGVAVVGSRKIDEAHQAFAQQIGEWCARDHLLIYSGGARGVDALTMGAALESQGQVVGILADSLEKTIRPIEARAAIERGNLTLMTPYSPNAGFSVGAAMGRNKLIYALANYAVVIASDVEKGGTWAGATEALKSKWLPVFVVNSPDSPKGNQILIQKGGAPLPKPLNLQGLSFAEWLAHHANDLPAQSIQEKLL